MKSNSKHIFLRNFAISGFLASLILLFTFFVDCLYMSNDDFGRQIIANGSLGATPSPYLYLTSTKIGYLINFFVKHNKLINWYYIYLIGNYLIFSTFIFFLILSNESKLSGKMIKLVLISAILNDYP
jgi:hypothetical protein